MDRPGYFFTQIDARTDLALEATDILRARVGREIPGVQVNEEKQDGLTVTRVQVLDERGEQAIGKVKGTYVTIEAPDLRQRNRELQEKVARVIGRELQGMLPPGNDYLVLVVGLGNWRATPDALGPRVVNNILVTRHLQDYVPQDLKGGLRPVAAIAPGVLGTTGIETGEVIRGIVDRIRPTAVVAIDALAARSVKRIMATIQIADSGIHPGSGVGTKRTGITRETLGVPVMAIGVPTVVHAITIASETLDLLVDQLRGSNQLYHILQQMGSQDQRRLIEEVLTPEVGDLMVTPKEVDALIDDTSHLLAGGINAALHPNIKLEEAFLYDS